MKKPFLAHSDLTGAIYIVVGNEKYEVTEQAKQAVKAVNKGQLKERNQKCKWIKYDYRTMCPKEHIDVDNPYWRLPENRMETLKFCPYCGKEIEVER